MSGFGLVLVVLTSVVMCMTTIGTCLLVAGLWKHFENKKEKEMVKEMEKLSATRLGQIARLEERGWWNATDASIRLKIAYLPEKWSGFFEDLIAREDVVGGLEHTKIIRFETDKGMFGGLVNFEVVNHHNNDQLQSYMYWSWRTGPKSGAKGQVFVATNGKVVGFVDITSEKFAVGGKATGDLVGGFGEPGEAILETAIRELKEELQSSVRVTKVVDLGDYFVDVGLTNNCPTLFYAIVEADTVPVFAKSDQHDKLEVTSEFKVRPFSEYFDYVATSKDGMTLAVFAKIVATGHLLGLMA